MALPVEQSVSILSANIGQNVHDNTSLRPRPRQHDFNTTPTTKGWRFALMPPWASRHICGSRSIHTIHRCPQGNAVGSPNAPQASTSRKQDSHTYTKTEHVDQSLTRIVTKHCPGEAFHIQPASSPALHTRMSSGRFSNLSLCGRTRFPWTGTLIKGEFVTTDTSVGAALDSDSLFAMATRFPVQDKE